jgi:hypothetical protein
MWYVVDKHRDIVVGSYSTRKEARWAKKSLDFLNGKNYRMEQI